MNDKKLQDPAPGEPPDDDVILYLAGMLDKERAHALEERAAQDPELAAKIRVLGMLTEASMHGDMETIGNVANALGVPLDDFVPDQYKIVADATFRLLNGAVTKQEADAYAAYRKEADQLGAHDQQTDELDARALEAVVQSGVMPNVEAAREAVLNVVNQLEPVLRKMAADASEEGKPTE